MERERWVVVATVAALSMVILAALVTTIAATVAVLDRDDEDGSAVATSAFHEGPVQAIVDLSEVGKEKWESTLGPSCNLDKIYVLALGQDARGVDVVSFPGDCNVNRFWVAEADGGVRPEDPLEIERRYQ